MMTNESPRPTLLQRIASACIGLLLAFSLSATGCASDASESASPSPSATPAATSSAAPSDTPSATSSDPADASDAASSESSSDQSGQELDPENLPVYDGDPYETVNDDQPTFTEADKERASFEEYAPLDALGRCGVAFALVGEETMPTEERGSIGQVKPSGWHLSKYDWVDGRYLFNRCHLLGYQLTGENANECNLITGTRYLNTQGMLPFEDELAQYVHRTGNHVLYRVTPVFEGDNLVASGVQMEAESVEDDGAGVCFNVYCFNVEPGVGIDYETGDNWADGSVAADGDAAGVSGALDASSALDAAGAAGGSGASGTSGASGASDASSSPDEESFYVLNTNTRKFHRPDCSSVQKIKAKNRQDFDGTRDQAEAQGYAPCKRCNP